MPPRGAQKEARDAAAKGSAIIRFSVDGRVYSLNIPRVTPALDRELFTQSGLTMAKVSDNFDSLFSIAALMFLASRQRGERVKYAQFEDGLSWESEIEILTDEVDEGPKAPD